MTTPKLDRATLEKAAEICEAQRWRGTASQLEAAIDELRTLAAALPQPELFLGAKFGPVLNEDGSITPARPALPQDKVPEGMVLAQKINDLLYAVGAPLGSETYFAIRKLCCDWLAASPAAPEEK